MLRKIKLYGELAEFVGHKEFEVQVDSLAKAVSFLINNFEGIDKFMNPKYYQVKVGNYEISEEEIHYPIGQEDIHFIPVISGAGRGGRRILGGVALIGLTVATGGFGGAAIGTFGLGAGSIGVGTLAVGIGASMVLSGVSEMLFPLPKPKEFSSEQDPRLSFSFSGTQQNSRAGTPVPIVYGEIFTGSVVISAGIDTEQVQA
tara:strand:- start:4032 stop:4637 length:606 start_codon:yes stop_codon:yes gene_type:complete